MPKIAKQDEKYAVLVFGAGKVGETIAHLLHHAQDYHVILADKDAAALERVKTRLPVETVKLDASSPSALRKQLSRVQAVISAGPYFVNTGIAQMALETGVNYFDLTEDRETTAAVRKFAAKAKKGQIFAPQCGLAPGFIGILAAHLAQGFDKIHEIKMRVGALPKYPSNMLMYNLTWSTDGVINEYINPAEAIIDGKLTEVQSLEGLEEFSLDGITYEAFNTSGGLGTLCETLEGKVQKLDYKSVRYPGHRYLMQFLLRDLRLSERRELVKDILENALPITPQDVVLTFCTVTGERDGRFTQISDARKIYDLEIHSEHWSAIQLTTAASVCAVLDLHRAGLLPKKGFVRQEDVPFEPYLENRFGRYYITKDPV
jgi:saccharopine dehydrogenase-like NADP-dependent oxidoreductase